MVFRFIITTVLGSTPIGELQLSDVSFNSPVHGQGSIFSGAAEINDVQTKDILRNLTTPDSVALYVRDDDTGGYLFGGPIYARPWNRESRRLSIQAQSWKSWLYSKLCGMNTAANPVTDTTFSFTAIDQLAISRSLISTVVNGDVGCPVINLGTEVSGVLRDLNFHGSDQKYLGSQIDSMSNRDRGFEWDIEPRADASNDPKLWFVPQFPAKGGLNNQVLLIHQQVGGGNILEMDDPEESTNERRSRVWTTGAGQPPDQVVAYDADPGLSGGFTLLRETVKNYSSVTQIATLASHALAERGFRNSALQQVRIGVGLDDPDYRLYASGDKIRLLVQDEWIDWDFTSVRIIDRSFVLNQSDVPDMIRLQIDLDDIALPAEVEVL